MPPEVASDSQWAWVSEAMEAHQSALIRYAHRLLNDGDQARDAVQEAFIKLCRQPREKVEDRVLPWLFRVVRNQFKAYKAFSSRAGLNGSDLGGTNPAYSLFQAFFGCRVRLCRRFRL